MFAKPTTIVSKTNIYVLLIFTALFYLATFFIQIRLITSSNKNEYDVDSSSSTTRTRSSISDEDKIHIKNALGISAKKLAGLVRIDFENCAQLIDANIELNDLLDIKASYLAELKKFEHKRQQLLKSLGKLNVQLNESKYELSVLERKSSLMRSKIKTNTFKLFDLDRQVGEKFEQLQSIKIAVEQSSTSIAKVTSPKLGLQNALDLTKCKYNQKFGIYVFNSAKTNEFVASFLANLDVEEIERSVRFEKAPKNACFLLVVLVNAKKNRHYYQSLVEFISENKKANFLFIIPNLAVSNESFSSRLQFEQFLSGLNPDYESLAKRIVRRGIFASFNGDFDRVDDLFVRFSVLLNDSYWTEAKAAADQFFSIDNSRKHLITYHKRLASNNSIEAHLVALQQVFDGHNNFLIDLDCDAVVIDMIIIILFRTGGFV